MIREILATSVLLVVLVGCTSGPVEPEAAPTAPPTREPAPTPTTTATLDSLDPAAFATQIDLFGPGVDFDSADRNVHCGIWDSRDSFYAGQTGPYVGCRPAVATYETDPSSSSEVGCRGGALVADSPAHPVCDSGQAFVGEDPSQYTVGVLEEGSQISYAGYTCTSPDPSAILCVRDADGAGFLVSGTEYRYF